MCGCRSSIGRWNGGSGYGGVFLFVATKPAWRYTSGRCVSRSNNWRLGRCLVQTSPPTWRFASRCPGSRVRSSAGLARGRAVGAIALKVLPIEAITAFIVWYALWHLVVLAEDVVNDIVNLVIANADSPFEVCYGVIHAL
jgi:hypothetical protein